MVEATAGATAGAQAGRDTRVIGRRVAATIVDSVVLLFVAWLLGVPGAIAAGVGDGNVVLNVFYDALSGVLTWYGAVVFVVLFHVYYVLAEGLYGRTLGKMAVGIKVVREDGGGRPGIGKAALRTLLRSTVDGFGSYLVAFVVALASGKNRRLGDMAAKTLVVRAQDDK